MYPKGVRADIGRCIFGSELGSKYAYTRYDIRAANYVQEMDVAIRVSAKIIWSCRDVRI